MGRRVGKKRRGEGTVSDRRKKGKGVRRAGTGKLGDGVLTAESSDGEKTLKTLLAGDLDGGLIRENAGRYNTVTHMHSDYGAIVKFNKADSTVTCACRKYESIGILCKHALKVFNMNDVFNLPSQYILHRWTKYAKRGFYIQKQGSEEESSKTQAAHISRKATSLALKCSKSKELLDELEKAIDKLDLDADNSLAKMQEESNEAPLVSADCATNTLTGRISFRVPEVVKGAKSKRGTISLEKNTGKKKKSARNKGQDSNNVAENSYEGAGPEQFIDLNVNGITPHLATDVFMNTSTIASPLIEDRFATATMPHFNMDGNSSIMGVPCIRGGYTSLLLGVDPNATLQPPSRKLNFDGPPNQENM